jgi:hypothetical protein
MAIHQGDSCCLGIDMKKDTEILKEIYHSIRTGDVYIIDEKSMEWDGVFPLEDFSSLDMIFFESFEKIRDREKIDVGFLDTYEIELRNGSKFVVNFSYNDAKQIRDISKKAIIEAEHKNQPEIVAGYETFSDIKDGEYVVLIEFKDADGRHDDTGKVGIYAKELFEMLKQSYIHSVSTDMKDNLRGIMMRVDKNNPKRMNFYQILLKKYLAQSFPNIFVDPNSNNTANFDLLIAAR